MAGPPAQRPPGSRPKSLLPPRPGERPPGANGPPSAPPAAAGTPGPPQGPASTVSILALAAGVAAFLAWFISPGLGPAGPVLSLGLPMAAIVLGIVARNDPRTSQSGRALALAGLILGIVELSLAALFFLFVLLVIASCRSSSTSGSADCGCSSCGDACSGCGQGCSGCGQGCSSCGDGCSGCSCSAAVLPFAVVVAPPPRRAWLPDLSHHPDTPAYAHDVYRVAGRRLCIGCFTTFPAFLGLFAVLPALPWAFLPVGIALAALQAVSAAGWARTRLSKASVKLALGIGLALAVRATLDLEWPKQAKALLLLALAALAFASTIPRQRRMARAAACPRHPDASGTPGS